MMFRTVSLMLVTLALVACGGSDNNAFEPGSKGGQGSAVVASLTVTASSGTVSSDGAITSTITALAKDANNNAVSGASVAFSASAGSVVIGSGTTDSSGAATATLSGSGLATGTSIVVTATSGTVSGKTTISVANTQQTVSIVTSTPQVPSDGSTSATITAYVRNSSNQFVAGVPVSFQASSGGLTVTQGTTDAGGAAIATLNSAGDKTNRTIVVTAANGATNAQVAIDVVGSKLTFTGNGSVVQGSQSTYTAALVDSGNVAISGQPVTFTSSNGNTLSSTTATTNSAGQATVNVTAANSGNDTLTATSLGLTAQQSVTVSNQNFAFSAPAANAHVNLNTTQTITITWLASNVAQAGKTITFTTTRGTLSAATATTDGSGQASVTITSANSGPAVITASSPGVTAQTTIDFIATNPTSVTVQATPANIPTQGQSTISAVVRDNANNLVEGQTVVFTTNDISGGSLTVAQSVTDVQGRAQTLYNASSTPSSSSGVQITAQVQGTGVSGQTTLTVGGQSVFISLGTGNHLTERNSQTQFVLPYSVTVVDSSGNPVANRQVTIAIHSVLYGKGTWRNPSAWVQTGDPTGQTTTPITVCPNEDSNLNGILETNLGEDVSGQGNHNGVLDPGDIATVDLPTVTTDSAGTAQFNVIYSEDHALWVQVRLTASTAASGTEATAAATFWLPMLADYLSNAATPPGTPSPYGKQTSCTNPL